MAKRKKASIFKKCTRMLYRAAIMSNDIDSIMTGSPTAIARRIMNKRIGRHINSKFNLR